MKITEEEIRRISSPTVYRRGVEYFREGRVHIRLRNPDELVAVIDDDEIYNVVVRFDEDNKIIDSYCTCPYFLTMNCTCKHIVASLKVRQKELEDGEGFADENDRLAKLLCTAFAEKDEDKIHLNASYVFKADVTDCNNPKYSISISIGSQKPESVNAIDAFLLAYLGIGEYKLSKFRSFSKDKYEFSELDEQILDILSESCQNKNSAGMYTKRLIFTDFGEMTAKRLFPLLIKAHTEFYVNDIRLTDMQVRIENPDIPIDVVARQGRITLSVPEGGYSLFTDGSWFLYAGDVYKTTPEWRKRHMPIYSTLSQSARTQVDFIGENSMLFASNVLPGLKNASGVVLDGVEEIVVAGEPEFFVYFDYDGKNVYAVVTVNYGSIRLRLPEDSPDYKGKIVVRKHMAENAVLKFFTSFNLINGTYVLDDTNEIYKFVTKELPELEKLAKITADSDFNAIRAKKEVEIKITAGYVKETDLLEVGFESELSAEDIKGVLSAIRLKNDYYRSLDGSFFSLEGKNNSAYLLGCLNIEEGDIDSGKKQLLKYHALYLAGLAESGRISKNDAFDQFIAEIKAVKADIPKHLEGVLRGYQKDAVNWMLMLEKLGFGGILADDMGLGKTLEVIAFVLCEKRSAPSLVVVPSALLYNWCNEIKRFAPDATCVVIDGSREERAQKLGKISGSDFVITSYPMLRRDGALYSEIEFENCFIDEAQYIKNPKTMNAHGVKRIRAKNRFALTGTPIENSLLELWSVFDYIMPGYLGSKNSFVQKYERPVMQGFEGASEALRMRIRPFTMRRLKKDVLLELPEKIEETMLSELCGEQKRMYSAFLAIAKEKANGYMKESNARFMILSLLTRLRQICCHPSLFDENYHKGSAKLDLLSEIVLSAIAGGHRLLVFSQFTSMLGIIKKELTQKGVDCFYLDGSTGARERVELVNRFNSGEKQVFLISLKAGGTGLNLTGADTVIHYDPWWNPAVTDQASDRAYRIGQTKAVHVIRLAASGTIEEKILKLQDRKRSLADDIITQNNASISSLTNEEILSLFDMD